MVSGTRGDRCGFHGGRQRQSISCGWGHRDRGAGVCLLEVALSPQHCQGVGGILESTGRAENII